MYKRNDSPRGGRGHMVANVILCVLASCSFLLAALFAYASIDAYIGSLSFDGNGINSDGLGFAFALVFTLIASGATLLFSLICGISSGVAVKIREGSVCAVSRLTLGLSVFYGIVDIIAVAVLLILGAS